MMVKLLGTAMFISCGAMMGASKLREEKETIANLEKIIRGLGILEGEIKLCSRPLPDAFEKMALEAGELFSPLAENCRNMSAAEVWEKWMEEQSLPYAAMEIMKSLGGVLGQYDGERQAVEIMAVRIGLGEIRDGIREKMNSSSKHYPLMGACFAGIAAMMII